MYRQAMLLAALWPLPGCDQCRFEQERQASCPRFFFSTWRSRLCRGVWFGGGGGSGRRCCCRARCRAAGFGLPSTGRGCSRADYLRLRQYLGKLCPEAVTGDGDLANDGTVCSCSCSCSLQVGCCLSCFCICLALPCPALSCLPVLHFGPGGAEGKSYSTFGSGHCVKTGNCGGGKKPCRPDFLRPTVANIV